MAHILYHNCGLKTLIREKSGVCALSLEYRSNQFGHCMLVTGLRWMIFSNAETLQNNNGCRNER